MPASYLAHTKENAIDHKYFKYAFSYEYNA